MVRPFQLPRSEPSHPFLIPGQPKTLACWSPPDYTAPAMATIATMATPQDGCSQVLGASCVISHGHGEARR